MTDTLRSYRFRSYWIGLLVLAGIVVLAILRGIPLESLDGVLAVLSAVILGQLGFGSWHDKGVRTAALTAPAPGSPGGEK